MSILERKNPGIVTRHSLKPAGRDIIRIDAFSWKSLASLSNMNPPELSSILQTIEKPLQYASGNSYGNLRKLKGLEPFIRHWLKKLLSFPLNPEQVKVIHHLEARIIGFDGLDFLDKRLRLLEIQEMLRNLKEKTLLPAEETLPLPTLEVFREGQKKLRTPIQFVKGIGPRLSALLAKKGIRTIEDALYFIPRQYIDRRQIRKISELTPGRIETVRGTILQADGVWRGRRRVFELHIGDETGVLIAKWFHFNPRVMKARFKKGMSLILSGEVRLFQFQKEMHHPEVEVCDGGEDSPSGGIPPLDDSLHFGRIIPIYSETEGLYQRQRWIRRIWKTIVDAYAPCAESGIPPEVCRRQGLLPLSEALRKVHFPDESDHWALLNEGKSPAHRRLIFDEFFFLELGLALRRSGTQREKGIAFPIQHRYTQALRRRLPFSLTPAQERVIAEIEADMRRPIPMNRLLQGDVGSGKTLVALMAALMAVEGGYQVALMAPTEILAEQHFFNLRSLVEPLGLRCSLLTSRLRRPLKDSIREEIERGECPIVIGTHALIQEAVNFKNLGLAIIDEQHKFGVLQRAALRKKGYRPDVLVMTATPIPRTLAMTLYGDLDVSIIDQLPPGRGPIATRVLSDTERFRAYRLLREEIGKGRQAYVVYPLVEESEQLDLKDATQMAKHLQRDIFPEFRVGLVHGQMKGEAKEAVMADFKDRKVQILVSTIVIEVGIDVPNATVMVIEHAERFGLSQLHQLRGRIGRGPDPSFCILMASPDTSEEGRRRLKVMEETTDGFRIAEEDLEIRGPGDLLGTQQSGLPDFRVAHFIRDFGLLAEARKEAFAIIEKDPLLSLPEHQIMKETLLFRWQGRLQLADVG
jgi:ATP-dependent DNA helicase RecG